MDAEDLRILLSQQEGVEVLIPRALTRLEQDPLLEGDFYPGDVLVAVLKAAEAYWRANPEQLARLERVITAARDLGALDDPDDLLKRRVREFYQRIRP